MPAPPSAVILMAEDDPDDRLLAAEALRETRAGDELRFVEDGEQLLDYLRRRGRWADPAQSPRPSLVLLDLNMPRMDGREALAAIKADPELRRIPVVVLTTSRSHDDVFRSYDQGANSFISKPVSFAGLVDAMRVLSTYWIDIVEPPPGGGGPGE
jgi:CheY-like chemotaxis protein